MALTDEQIFDAISPFYVERGIARAALEMSGDEYRAIESAATAPLLEQIAQLEQQLAEARKDADRYQWLRKDRPVLLLTGYFGNGCVNRTIVEVDAAIDAAIARTKEQR